MPYFRREKLQRSPHDIRRLEVEMHIILGAIAIATAIYFIFIRARNAAEVTSDILDVANDVRLAARRFGFRRNAAEHPAEAIDDPRIAVASVTYAMLMIENAPTREELDAMNEALDDEYPLTRAEAEEMQVLARWLAGQCGSPDAAVSRLSRKLYKLSGKAGVGPLLNVIGATFRISGSEMSPRQKEALEDISRALHIS